MAYNQRRIQTAPAKPRQCAWGYRGEACPWTTTAVFCDGHRRALDRMIVGAKRFVGSLGAL